MAVASQLERQIRMNIWKKVLAVSCLCAATSSPFAAYADASKSVHEATLVAAPADYENIAVSQVSDYVNIREQATTNSKIVGKIYNNCAATILETVEGEGGSWYRIQSGSVNGFIKSQYFITGQEAETLAQSSVHRAAVVCGAGGYDEITPIGPNEMIILDDGKLEPLTLDPADYGIPACTPEDLAVSSRDEAVAVLRELLAGRGPEAMRNMLALNVGMSIYLLEGKLPLATCIAKAREALASGVGGRVLHAA